MQFITIFSVKCMKKIAVLMSTYNGSEFLRDQLDSIIEQKDVTIKLIIRDDCSCDEGKTLDILEEYKSKYPEVISLYKGKENIGYRKSFHKLVSIALELYPELNYFAFADQDDVWLPDKLNRGVKILSQSCDKNIIIPCMYCSNTELVDSKLRHIRYCWNENEVRISKDRALVQSFATGCTCVFNRQAAVMYATRYSYQYPSAHDYFLYQTCVYFGKVIWDKESRIKYRQHGSNQIGIPSFKIRLKKKVLGLFSKNHALENQNRVFYNCYYQLLEEEDRQQIENFINYRNIFKLRMKLIFSPSVKYTNLESNISFIIKALIGKV